MKRTEFNVGVFYFISFTFKLKISIEVKFYVCSAPRQPVGHL